MVLSNNHPLTPVKIGKLVITENWTKNKNQKNQIIKCTFFS